MIKRKRQSLLIHNITLLKQETKKREKIEKKYERIGPLNYDIQNSACLFTSNK